MLFQLAVLSCRNEALKRAGIKFPTPIKTGTTIAGIVFKVSREQCWFGQVKWKCNVCVCMYARESPSPFQDGVILGADTRATEVNENVLLRYADNILSVRL